MKGNLSKRKGLLSSITSEHLTVISEKVGAGKEEKVNKITSLASDEPLIYKDIQETNDEKYPSEKYIKESLEILSDSVETAASMAENAAMLKEDKSNKVNVLVHGEHDDEQYPSAVAVIELLDAAIESTQRDNDDLEERVDIQLDKKEDKSNKVTSITPESTNEQYPSAKAVYDKISNVEDTAILANQSAQGVNSALEEYKTSNNEAVNTLNTGLQYASDKAESAYSIAAGRNSSRVYEDYEGFIAWANSFTYENLGNVLIPENSPSDYAPVGTNIYIKEVEVPDLWIMEIFTSESSEDVESNAQTAGITINELINIQLGNWGYFFTKWFKMGILETQKVDLNEYPTNSEMYFLLNGKENISNKVTEISSLSTDEQYPSAKAVYETFLKAIPQKEEESSDKSISITGAVPGLDVINYSIWGKCVQETQPVKDSPQEVLCVGDLVTDSSDINYGKYKISYTYNAEEYALYLEEPLRGIVSYGYGGNSSNYRYILDYIDFKSQKVIRNVKEEVITDISSIPEQGNIIYITAGLSDFYVRTVKGYSDMTTEHPGGVSNIGDVLSNCVQRLVRSGGSYVQSDSYVMAVDGYNNIYYYWDLNVLGFRVEEGTESDYLLKTSGASPAYYNVYDGETKLTSFSQIRQRIGEIYDGKDFKIYYPLKTPAEESIEIPEMTVPGGGEVSLTVNTQTEPEKVGAEYYADISQEIKEMEEKIEELTKAVLSNGGNI